jgi:hypothetical protein
MHIQTACPFNDDSIEKHPFYGINVEAGATTRAGLISHECFPKEGATIRDAPWSVESD